MATMLLLDAETTGNGPIMPTGAFSANTPTNVGALVRGLDGASVQLYFGETDVEADLVPLRDGLFEADEATLIRLPRGGYIQARVDGTSSTATTMLLLGD